METSAAVFGIGADIGTAFDSALSTQDLAGAATVFTTSLEADQAACFVAKLFAVAAMLGVALKIDTTPEFGGGRAGSMGIDFFADFEEGHP